MYTDNFLIYDASAGSGKTYTLAKEYIKILLTSNTNDSYKKILAITFTNKAVNEMKNRIVTYLQDFTNENPGEKTLGLMQSIANETNLTIDDIREKSKHIIKNIIHNYASFDISTIDKFTHRLIRTFALDLGLPATFEVSLDQKAILQEAVDRIIAKAGVDEQLTKVLIDFALHKTDEGKSWDFTFDLLEVGELLNKETNRAEIDEIKDLSLDDFIATRKKLIEINKLILEYITNKSLNILQYIKEQNFDEKAFSRNTFINYLNKIALGDLPVDVNYLSEDDVLAKISKKNIEAVSPHIPFFLQELDFIYTWQGRYLMYEETIKNLTPLSLLNSIAKEVKLVQQEQNILSIAEFNKIIFDEIQSQPAPFIYERLGDRYRHFFVDEFQDTSEMQWKNIIPLIDHSLSGTDDSGSVGSLMIVGDPKQSIYRWRGGKAEQFIALAKDDEGENPFSNPNKLVKRLTTNHRSYKQVIEFNNSFFAFISSKFLNTDYEDLYLNKSRQYPNSKEGGFVSIEFIEEAEKAEADDELSKNELYLKKTIEIITKVKDQGFNYGDIILLTRKRSQGILLANFLTENQIPIISSETLLLSNSDEVNFIINILKLLKIFSDKEAKMEALYYIATYIVPVVQTHDFVSNGLSAKTEQDLEYFIQQNTTIAFSFTDNKRKPLYEICEEIITKFLPQKANVSYVQYFLDIVLEHDMKWQHGLSDFLDYWQKNKEKYSIPSPENTDAVQIMTVHKSKGLEFPVVIYPFAEEDFTRTPKDKLWLDLVTDEELPIKRALLRNTKHTQSFSEQAAEIIFDVNEQQLLDTINVLYVALTRAEEQLYIITTKNKNKDGYSTTNLSTYFIDYLESVKEYDANKNEYTFGEPTKVSEKREGLKPIHYIENVTHSGLKKSAVKIAVKETLMWGDYREKAIEFGNMVHHILSYIKYPVDVQKSLDKALRQGILSKEFYDSVKYIVENIVNHPDLKEHFSTEAKVFNEQSIIKIKNNTIKPDRVTIYKNKVTLIDYKTGQKNNQYIEQLKEYELALIEMNYEVVKKTILYIGDKIEIVNL